MSTNVPGFQSSFSVFLHHFVMAELATSSIRVNEPNYTCTMSLKFKTQLPVLHDFLKTSLILSLFAFCT